MTDNVTILSATGALFLVKTWRADGEVAPYDTAKNFTLVEKPVADIHALSQLLFSLERKQKSAVIRGRYVGDERAVPLMRDTKGWAGEGKVLRQEILFADEPHHWLCIDVDRYRPAADPMTEPVEAIDEFVTRLLPECFHGRSYHWQMSNSAGHANHVGVLKAHLWFWLETPYNGPTLDAWAEGLPGSPVDRSLFRTVQLHYTGRPRFEDGVSDPLPERSGFVEGFFGDVVPLVLDVVEARVAGEGRVTRSEMSRSAAMADPVGRMLFDKGMVRSVEDTGALNVVCPRQSEHSDEKTGPKSTFYYPRFTMGHSEGRFVCMHAHCRGVGQVAFLDALGFGVEQLFDEAAADFESVGGTCTGDEGVDDFFAERVAVKRERVPQAKHLTTDQANVQRMLSHFGARLIVANDRWYAWNGRRWVPDDSMVTRYALSLSKIVAGEAEVWRKKVAKDGNEKEKNEAVAEALSKWAVKCEMRATVDAAISLAKRVLVVDEALLDADPWLLNCANGTVDLRTGELKDHDPDNYITKLCPVPYEAGAKAEMFVAVLRKVTREEGGPDPVCRFLLRWFGYCATGSTREQKFLVHYGMGSNGKSTILDVVSEVLGDYSATAAPGLMVSTSKERHPTEIADLFGRRMVTAHESGEGGILREDFIKQATGGDKLKARYMRADFFEFSPTHKLQLLTNHKPVIKGQDAGIWRRVMMMHYRASFGTPEEVALGHAQYVKDTKIVAKVRQELPGVLALLVRGAVEWYRDGLNPPDYVLSASEDYKKEQDRVGQFIDECCDVSKDLQCFLTAPGHEGCLYPAYEFWCRESGFMPMSKNKFLAEVLRAVPGSSKSSVKRAAGGKRRDLIQLQGLAVASDF